MFLCARSASAAVLSFSSPTDLWQDVFQIWAIHVVQLSFPIHSSLLCLVESNSSKPTHVIIQARTYLDLTQRDRFTIMKYSIGQMNLKLILISQIRTDCCNCFLVSLQPLLSDLLVFNCIVLLSYAVAKSKQTILYIFLIKIKFFGI